MRLLAWLLFFPLLCAGLLGCGGGGNSPMVVATLPRAFPVQVAYWGAVDANAADEAAETGTIQTMGWGPDGYDKHVERQLLSAKSMGATSATLAVDTIMAVDGHESDRVRASLKLLQTRGLLPMVSILFVVDEAEQHGFSAADVEGAVQKLRAVASEFPELAGVRYEASYGCANEFVGWQALDIVGCDRYDRSADETLGNLKAKAPGKLYRLYSGGANPWRADPMPYVNLALCDGSVVGVTYFIRSTTTDRGNTYEGIATNGMAPAYSAASQLARSGACRK